MFLNMKSLKVFIYLLTMIISCKTNYVHEFAKFNELAVNKNAIIVSCLRCDCVIDALNYVYETDSNLINSYDIYVDEKCKSTLSKKIKTINYKQSTIDSISLNFYNMLIVKKKNDKFSYEMIKNEDAKKILQILK